MSKTIAGVRVIALTLLLTHLAYRPSQASNGVAHGKVGIVDTRAEVFGFSTYTGQWSSDALDSPGVARLAGQFLGYLRTATRLYAFNALNNTWHTSTYDGLPLGEDVEGGTAIFWSTTGAYVASTMWTSWSTQLFANGEQPLGGGSGVNLALAWTPHRAYAFRVATGQWVSQPLVNSCVGGIASDGLGLVWTNGGAHSYDPADGVWIALDLRNPQGVSVTGSGNVGLVWTSTVAQAYSGTLNGWFQQLSGTILEGGSAWGEIALLWGADTAFVFDANTGLWSSQALQSPSAANELPGVGLSALRVAPNPCAGDRVALRLTGDRAWSVGVFDAEGRCVRAFNVPASTAPDALAWDRTDASGRRVAAGSYWIRAESDESSEARKIVLLN